MRKYRIKECKAMMNMFYQPQERICFIWVGVKVNDYGRGFVCFETIELAEKAIFKSLSNKKVKKNKVVKTFKF